LGRLADQDICRRLWNTTFMHKPGRLSYERTVQN